MSSNPLSSRDLVEPHCLEWLTGIPSLSNEVTDRLVYLYERGLQMSATSPARKIRRNYLTLSGQIAGTREHLGKYFEGPLESDFYMMLDFDWLVDRFYPQPVTIPYVDPTGMEREYTPDVLIFFRTGLAGARGMKPILGEVKSKESIEREGELHDWQTKAGERHARENGWRYRFFTEDDIRIPYLKNAKFLRRFRDQHHTNRAHSDAMEATLISNGEIEIEELVRRAAATLSPAGMSEGDRRALELSMLPTLWLRLTGNSIYVNFGEPLDMSTKVRPSKPDDRQFSLFR
jgi:hypothetical protein